MLKNINLFKFKKNLNFNNFPNFKLIKFPFSEKKGTDSSTRSEITISKKEDELEISVPLDYQPLYTFGNFGRLPLFNNTKDLGKFSGFIPLHKTNILLFSMYTYFSYGTALFQPSLLLTLYVVNKFFLISSRKEVEILFIALNSDCTTLLVKTFYRDLMLELSETKISAKPTKLGSKSYYELTNEQIRHPLYLNVTDGQVLSNDLFQSMLSGNISKVNFIYS